MKKFLFVTVSLMAALALVFLYKNNKDLSKKIEQRYIKHKQIYDIFDKFDLNKFKYNTTDIYANVNAKNINFSSEEIPNSNRLYYNFNTSGEKLEKEIITSYEKLFSEDYLNLTTQKEAKSLSNTVEDILSENSLDLTWYEKFLTSSNFGCPEQLGSQMCSDVGTVFWLRVNPEYKQTEIINSGYLLKLNKKDSGYVGGLVSEGEDYAYDSVNEYNVKLIDSFEEGLPPEKYFITRNHYTESKYDYFKEVEIDLYKKYFYAVRYDNDKTALVPITAMFGHQDNEEVYGLVDSIDYGEVFSERLLGEDFSKENERLIIKPITSIALNDHYVFKGYIPSFSYVLSKKVFGEEFTNLKLIEVEDFEIGVRPTEIKNGYGEDKYVYLKDIKVKNFGYNLDKGWFEFEVDDEEFWKAYTYDVVQSSQGVTTKLSGDKILRDRRDNKLDIEICISFKHEEFLPKGLDEKVCDVYTTSIPIPENVI